jgi:hypothetical protein
LPKHATKHTKNRWHTLPKKPMNKEDVTNRKELMIFLLLELNKKNCLVDFGDFFMESGYAQGIDSFRKILEDMTEKGWLTKFEERTGKYALGMPHLPLLDLRFGIDIGGIDYLSSLGLIEDKFKTPEKSDNNNFISVSGNNNKIGDLNQSLSENNDRVTKAPKRETHMIKEILIGILITVVGGLIIYFLTQ